MLSWFVGGIVLVSIGIVFLYKPSQFFIRDEIMIKKIDSRPSYKNIFKFIGYILIVSGSLLICLGISKLIA